MARISVLIIALFAIHTYGATFFANLCRTHKWKSVHSQIKRQPTKIGKHTVRVCLNQAVCEGENGLASYFLNLNKNAVSAISKTCVVKAIRNGHLEILKVARKHGLKLPAVLKGETVLHWAAQSKKPRGFTAFFLEANYDAPSPFIDLDARSQLTGKTALSELLLRKEYDAAMLLVEAGASLPEAVHWRDRSGFAEVLGADVGQKDFVDSWFKYHSTVEVKAFFKNPEYSNLHKNGLLKILLVNTDDSTNSELKRLWRKHEKRKLSELLKTKEGPGKDVKKPAEKKNKVSKICVDACDHQPDDKRTYCKVGSCHHRICKDCANELVADIVQSSKPLACPIDKCGKKIPWKNVKPLRFEKETIKRLDIKDVERELSADPKFNHCHRPDCSGGAYKTIVFGESPSRHFECEVCGHLQCKKCGKAHPKLECADKEIRKNEKYITAQMKKNRIKKCPNCEVPINKHMGCDHMYCSRCSCAFNWSNLSRRDGGRARPARPMVAAKPLPIVEVSSSSDDPDESDTWDTSDTSESSQGEESWEEEEGLEEEEGSETSETSDHDA